VSFLLGLPGTSKEEIPEFGWIEPCLKADRLVYIGLRDIDAGEKKILKENSKPRGVRGVVEERSVLTATPLPRRHQVLLHVPRRQVRHRQGRRDGP